MCWKSDKVTFEFIDTPARGLRRSRRPSWAGFGHVLLDNIVTTREWRKASPLLDIENNVFFSSCQGSFVSSPRVERKSRVLINISCKEALKVSSKNFPQLHPIQSPSPKHCLTVFSYFHFYTKIVTTVGLGKQSFLSMRWETTSCKNRGPHQSTYPLVRPTFQFTSPINTIT